MRNDEPRAVMVHKDFYKGGKALIVLGGPSAENWKMLRDFITPDVIIGANGSNKIPLDYWLCVENMSFPAKKAEEGEQRYIDIMKSFNKLGPTTRFVNRKSVQFLEDRENVIPIRRSHIEDPAGFDFRDYGEGFINGKLMNRPEVGVPLRAGTVGLQCLHLAGILGISEIHTIGYDLMLKGSHHWYQYPNYEPTRFYTEQMFTTHKGAKTMWFWVDTVEYLKKVEQEFSFHGIMWKDYSDGLIQLEKLEASKGTRWN